MLTDRLASLAARRPDDRGFTFLDDGETEGAVLTWSELDARSRRVASAIGRRAGRGARVLLLFPPGLDFMPAFFGSLYAGTIAVAAYPPAGARPDRTALRLRGMVQDAAVSLVLAPAAIAARRSALETIVPELRGIAWLDLESALSEPGAFATGTADAHDVAFLQYTSGSTTRPRGVMVTHANLVHNLACSAHLAGHGPESAGVSWLPVNHDMGLIEGVLQPVFSGFPAWLMAPAAFLQRPVRWLRAISRVRATHSGAPDFAYALCAQRIGEDDRRSIDLSSWHTAFNGAEPVRQSTLELFQRTFGECGFRWTTFRPSYGLAESTLLVSSQQLGAEPAAIRVDPRDLERGRVRVATGRDAKPFVSCGSACDPADPGRSRGGSEIAIVDPVGRTRCAPDAIGEIWLRGPSVAAGYWNQPHETTAAFKARLADTHEGPFLRTGDLGFLRDGHLFVTGRIKDVIIVRGLKHYPQDIEITAERAHPAIRQGCCAAFNIDPNGDDRLAVIAEIAPRRPHQLTPIDRDDRSESSRIIDAIRRAVVEAHSLVPSHVALVEAGTLPRTTSGKLQRFLCRDALRARTMEAIAVWSDESTAAPQERAS